MHRFARFHGGAFVGTISSKPSKPLENVWAKLNDICIMKTTPGRNDTSMTDRVVIEMASGIADVRIARAEKMNALDEFLFEALVDAARRLAQERELRAVVLSGDGKAFCAGIDKDCLALLSAAGAGVLAQRSHGITNLYQQAVWGWHELPVPVIAAVHGVAYGAGFQLTLGADIRIAAPDTRFCVMEVLFGLVPDMCGTQLMRHLARDDVIRELTYTGRIFSADEALAYGFITRIAPDYRAQAIALARGIARHSPDAVRAAKKLFNGASTAEAGAAFLAESDAQDRLIGSSNQVEAAAASRERRSPQFMD
jgi:enoyl-CoA hydratase/carnithine racemase